MLKKEITYTDYNGNTRTEDFYFHLNKAEIMEMELSTTGGLSGMVERIVKADNTPAIVKVFKDLILHAYGEKTADGRGFSKVDEHGFPLSRKFEETEAYSELFMELATDDKAAAAFINGIIPADVAKELAENPKITPMH